MPRVEDGVNLDLPSGLTSRPATAADAGAILELIATCEVDADGVPEVEEHDITVAFGRRGFDPELDTQLVFEDGELVGWADLYRSRGEGDVRPTHRSRGIGTALLEWMERRAQSLGNTEVGQTKTDANLGARDMFLARGYEPSWVSWVIRIAFEEPPPAPEPIHGIEIRPYQPSDARDVHRVVDTAFSEWPGRDPEPFEVWASDDLAHPKFAPEISPLAFDGDELVGVLLAFDYPGAQRGLDHPARDQGQPPEAGDRPGAVADVVRLVLRTGPAGRRRLHRHADRRARPVREGGDARAASVHPLHQAPRLSGG